jgi:hypothetical protein
MKRYKEVHQGNRETNSTIHSDFIAAGEVFISYAREDDEPFVERLYRDLELSRTRL